MVGKETAHKSETWYFIFNYPLHYAYQFWDQEVWRYDEEDSPVAFSLKAPVEDDIPHDVEQDETWRQEGWKERGKSLS